MVHRKKKIITWTSSILATATVIIAACGIYISDYYHADQQAIKSFSYSENIKIERLNDGIISYSPNEIKAGFIFYPGGKVEYTSYEPLMLACAEHGILCILLEMPFNLAVLDMNAADEIRGQFPEVKNWYLGGHSLGGSMAASYVSKNTDDFNGLVLLGSYSTANISDSNIKVLSIYGSEDNVLNKENYEENRRNLPKNFTEFIIDGGCHAYFGMYGSQDGDGFPTITNEEQIRITADEICRGICK